MSEYMAKHSVSKLIGSPPGYVGYEEGGGLSEKVRRHPYSVVLFDEIEKAHPDIFHLLLQILDDGVLTDSMGRTANFKNTVVILTTNIGATEKEHTGVLGFSSGASDVVDAEKDIRMRALREHFRPEFLNRIDEIIVFERLTAESMRQIAKNMLMEVKERIAAIGIEVEFDDSVADAIASHGDIARFGARPLRREIFAKVEDAFSLWILEGELREGDRVFVKMENGKLCVCDRTVASGV
jgi:ATP-dependent Clp protease ATP-binding subunit ClpC